MWKSLEKFRKSFWIKKSENQTINLIEQFGESKHSVSWKIRRIKKNDESKNSANRINLSYSIIFWKIQFPKSLENWNNSKLKIIKSNFSQKNLLSISPCDDWWFSKWTLVAASYPIVQFAPLQASQSYTGLGQVRTTSPVQLFVNK